MFGITKTVFGGFLLVILAGGLIFFIANTPSANLQSILDAFKNGDISGSINAIVDASIAFASNVKDKFNGQELASTLNSVINKVMSYTQHAAKQAPSAP